jgi:hypothetical protein
MDRYLTRPLDHDSVWTFIRGADEWHLRTFERQTGYRMQLAAAADWHGARDAQGPCTGA